MKTIKITESELTNIIKRVLNEQDYSTDIDRPTQPREKDIKSLFGTKYGAYVPNDVLRYMRKNPKQMFARLYDIYGDMAFEYLNMAKQKGGITESEEHMENDRYMFFSNLEQMERQCGLLLDLDHGQLESILDNGHDWAQDHIAEAKNNLDQVFDFLMNETKNYHKMGDEVMVPSDMEMMEEGRKKSGTKLCARGKAAAKAKFKVYPSAYGNGFAVQVCKGRMKGLDGKKRCSPPYC